MNNAALLKLMESVGQKLIILVKNRIQSSGKSADGVFSPYSTEYRTVRKKESLQVHYKDFTRTGKMFDDFKVLEVKFDGVLVSVTIGMSDAKYQKIANSHSNREGGLIIEPSQSELGDVMDFFKQEFLKI